MPPTTCSNRARTERNRAKQGKIDMEATMPRKAPTWSMLMGFASFIIIHACAENYEMGRHQFSGGGRFRDDMRKMQEFKASLIRHDSITAAPPSVSPSPSPSYADPPPVINSFVYKSLSCS